MTHPSEPPPPASRRVGLVTDDPHVTQTISLALSSLGARLWQARTTADADAILRSRGLVLRVVDHASALLPRLQIPECDSCAMVRCFADDGDLALHLDFGSGCRVKIFGRHQLAALVDELQHRLPMQADDASLDSILGDAPAMQLIRDQLRSVARYRDVAVLILGETGTGKELLAQAIHGLSAQNRGSFVAINCAAIPESLFESELFGHEAGSYTGARGVRVGLLEAAGTGTVFLDEVGEMPLPMQAKLLRVLETRMFRRVGANRDLPLHARIVSATNRGLGGWSEATLRADLLYRLAGFTLTLPPLRERGSDIEKLANAFLRAFAERHHAEPKWLSPEAVAVLRGQSWPGNVRELRSVVEHVAIVSKGAEIGSVEVADAVARSPKRRKSSVPAAPAAPTEPTLPTMRSFPSESLASTGGLRDVEREMILRAYVDSERNLSRAAKQLAIPRTTLRDKLRRYGAL